MKHVFGPKVCVAAATLVAAAAGCGGNGHVTATDQRAYAREPSSRCVEKLAVTADVWDVSKYNHDARRGAVSATTQAGKSVLILFGRRASDAKLLADVLKGGPDHYSVAKRNNVAIGWSAKPEDAERSFVEGCLRSPPTRAEIRAARARVAARNREAAAEAAEIKAIEKQADAEFARFKNDRGLMTLFGHCTEPLPTLNAEVHRAWHLLLSDGYPMPFQTFEQGVASSIPRSLGRTRCADVMSAYIIVLENTP
jgi:hypothetical protein